MADRGIDLTIFSPRASAMGHHVGDEAVSAGLDPARATTSSPGWSGCSRSTSPGSASCRSRPGCRSSSSVAELRRCVEELGFVGVNLNPDPSGGHWTAPPLTDRHWYPFYEAMVELDVPAMVHVSAVTNPAFHATGSHYLNADTTAFMQLLAGRPVPRPPRPAAGDPARRRAPCRTTGAGSGASPTCSADRRSSRP